MWRSCAVLLLTGLGSLAADESKPRNLARETKARADELVAKGEWVDAGIELRKLLFADPGDGYAKKQLAKVNTTLSEMLVESGTARWDSDREEGLKSLRAAARILPDGDAVKKAFKARGYEWFAGEWRTEDEIQTYKKADIELGARRRTELGLGPEFKIIREGPFRFFTDVTGGRTKLEQMLNAAQTHYGVYVDFMRALSPRYPSEGLDVVFFQKRDDYKRLTKSDDTLGVYVPKREAGFYYLTGQGEDFATLLHEMTHQLDHKVAKLVIDHAAVQEGLAEYFGYGQLTSNCTKLALGKLHSDSTQRIKDILFGREGTSLDMASFTEVEDPEGNAFYARSWGLVYFLLHAYPNGRFVLYEILSSSSVRPEVGGEPRTRTLREVLESMGNTVGQFEKDFRKYFEAAR